MEYNYKALNQKKDELFQVIRQAIPNSAVAPNDCADSVMESFVQLTPPESPKIMIHGIITLPPSGGGGGRSRKPGNIYLNWRKLMDLVPDITIAVAGGATSQLWLLPFIGLCIWNKLWCKSEEQLSEIEATIIYAFWKNRNSENKISEDYGFERVNFVRQEISLPILSRKEFHTAIIRLFELKCIKIEEGIIWLRESVCIKY